MCGTDTTTRTLQVVITTIFSWLDSYHMQEFWDNSAAHREDIMKFVNDRKEPSVYFNGIFTYWIGYMILRLFI